ncbi:hypothetical protein OJAV_G00135540 [Oryzias javanicus]|uniref:Uncharacterized protein n=1 Tax=Oryzias javanicus TaxID=123683 RepID=A0A3S2P3I5_ORYJA|nr:hypothetical protein OJAV_G00135540 [Oryzias javanicus]
MKHLDHKRARFCPLRLNLQLEHGEGLRRPAEARLRTAPNRPEHTRAAPLLHLLLRARPSAHEPLSGAVRAQKSRFSVREPAVNGDGRSFAHG